MINNHFDPAASRQRCLRYRRRILEMSQQVSALHIAPAFSCLEIADALYHGVMRREADGSFRDTFVMSKGHGCLSQYVLLEDFGILATRDLELYCKPEGRLGAHPDAGLPGIAASTGSLGHGMALGVGMAQGDLIRREDRSVYLILSDGELQEGSTWEAMMMAANLGTRNLIACLDLNGFQSFGRTSETHPAFYPVADKVRAFGWECAEVNGHDTGAIVDAIAGRTGDRPFFVVCKTVKGRGVSFMENTPIWHYRSPNPAEYAQALSELAEIGQ
jgi:transketolase